MPSFAVSGVAQLTRGSLALLPIAALVACMADGRSFDAAAVPPDVILPIELADARAYAQVKVNGAGPYRFLIDTGASGMGRVDTRLVQALALPLAGEGQNSDGVTVTPIALVRVGTLALGGLRRNDLELPSRDYNGGRTSGAMTQGLIGRDFFADGLVELDFSAGTLRYSTADRLDASDPQVLAYDRPFRIPIRIGEVTMEGNLDTGSSLTLHLPRTMLEHIATGPLEETGQARRANTVFQLFRTKLRDPVYIGGLVVTDVEVYVSDQVQQVNIGAGLLKDATVAFDQRARLVRVRPSPARPEG